MDKRDWQRLILIRTHCEDILSFVKRFGRDFQSFISDRAYFNAVAMGIMQIGELANGLSDSFCDQTIQQIPWKSIRGMRNWIAHAYGELDEAALWETVLNDIPVLLRFCLCYTNTNQ